MEDADFLVDDKMRETVMELSPADQLQVKLEVLKKCINIESIEEMIVFIEQMIYFTRIKTPEEEVPMIVSEENAEQ